jgi:hypothetical protein
MVKSLYEILGTLKGKKKRGPGAVSAETSQSDHYCTNRPDVSVNVGVPPQAVSGGAR